MCLSNAVNINEHIHGLLRGMVARKPQIYQQWLLYQIPNSNNFLLGYKICSSTLPSTPSVYKWYTYVYTNKVCQCMPIHSTNLISLVPPCHFFKEQHEIKMGNPGVPICVWSVSRFKTSLCFNSLRFWRSLWITWLLATFSPQPQMIKVPVAASGCQRHNSRSWKEVHL